MINNSTKSQQNEQRPLTPNQVELLLKKSLNRHDQQFYKKSTKRTTASRPKPSRIILKKNYNNSTKLKKTNNYLSLPQTKYNYYEKKVYIVMVNNSTKINETTTSQPKISRIIMKREFKQ